MIMHVVRVRLCMVEVAYVASFVSAAIRRWVCSVTLLRWQKMLCSIYGSINGCMSRYSDKHGAMCAHSQECEAPGTVLSTVRGRLEWLCVEHSRPTQKRET
jgi:hypothetical protein